MEDSCRDDTTRLHFKTQRIHRVALKRGEEEKGNAAGNETSIFAGVTGERCLMGEEGGGREGDTYADVLVLSCCGFWTF